MAEPGSLPGRRLLYVLWDGGGNVATALMMLRSLAAHGVQVTVLSNPSVRDHALDAGMEFREFVHTPRHDPRTTAGDLLKIWEATSPAQASQLIRDRMMFGPADAICRDTREVAVQINADLMAADYTLFGSLVAAESLGLPHVALMNAIYPLPTPELRGVEAARQGPFTYLFARMVNQGLPVLNEVRARHGLAPLQRAEQQYHRADQVVVTTYPSFDPAAGSVPDRVTYIGPQIDLAANPPRQTWPRPPRTRPKLLIALATSQQPGQLPLAHRLIEAAGTLEADTEVLGGLLDRFTGEVPANVRGRGYYPIEQLLPETDLVVTHSGIGTVVRSMLWGVPVLALPAAQEEFNNARLVESRGAGRQLRRDQPVPVYAEAMRALLADQRYRDAAFAWGEQFRSEDRPLAAVEVFSRLARSAGPARVPTD